MVSTNNNLIYLIDQFVLRLEDDGYPFVEILEALDEYTAVGMDIYGNEPY